MKFKIAMCALAFGLCATVQADIIKGTVKGEGKALGEVIVTDGYSFSVTDKNGNYKIDLNEKAEFVYLLTPKGYVADFSTGVPQFFQPVEQSKKQYDLVLKFIRKRSWNLNHQNLDGNTIGHLLVKDTSVSALRILEHLTKSKRYLLNLKNKNGETVLDRAIHNQSAFQALKILEEKRFNNIDVLSFKQLCQLCIKNNYYGKYSKLTNLENIVDSLEKKDGLVPSMSELLDKIVDNLEVIKLDLEKGKFSLLDQMINTSLKESVM